MSRRIILALAFTIFLDFVGFGMILPVLPYFALELGASATEVTLLASVFSAVQLLSAPILGRLSDRIGRKPVMMISIAGAIVTSLMIATATSFWLVIVARALSGASKSNMSTASAAIADVAPREERAKYMGILGAALGMGFVFGPAFGGALSLKTSPMMPFFVAAGLSVLNLILVWFWLPETRKKTAASPAVPERLAEVPVENVAEEGRRAGAFRLVLFISFLFSTAFALMEAIFALFNERLFGWGPQETGYFLTYIGLIVALVQGGVVGRLAKKITEAKSVVIGVAAMGVGMLLAGVAPWLPTMFGIDLLVDGSISNGALAVYACAGAGMAIGNALIMANSSALASRLAPANKQGGHLGQRESAAALGRVVGPTIAGPLFDLWHPAAPMLASAVVCGLNLIVTLILVRRLKHVSSL